jgi:hypothetical protein
VNLEYQIALPLAVSLVLFVVVGWIRPEDTPERDALISAINSDGDGAAATVPAAPEPPLQPSPAAE